MAYFHELPIGTKFEEKNVATGHVMVFVKVSKSQATCTAQIGYGNTRFVGARKAFASFSRVAS